MVLLHFTSPDCAVCSALKPRLAALLAGEFPQVVLAEVDCVAAPDVAAQQQVFAVPTLLLFVMGRESQRWVRNLHLSELREALARPYPLLFGDEDA
jgi:thioredoxin 1